MYAFSVKLCVISTNSTKYLAKHLIFFFYSIHTILKKNVCWLSPRSGLGSWTRGTLPSAFGRRNDWRFVRSARLIFIAVIHPGSSCTEPLALKNNTIQFDSILHHRLGFVNQNHLIVIILINIHLILQVHW